MTDNPTEEYIILEGKDVKYVVLGDEGEVDNLEDNEQENDTEDELEEWSTAYINDLPDSAFAVVEPCADERKDARHLPYKDKDGSIDEEHLQNALARMNQIKAVCEGSSTESLRDKAEKVLVPLAKKHFPDSKWAKNDDEEDSSHSVGMSDDVEGDNMTEDNKSDELESVKKQLEEKTSELTEKEKKLSEALETIKSIEENRIKELASKVFELESKVMDVDEDNKGERVSELTSMGENALKSLFSTYETLVAKQKETENSDANPKAKNLSENTSEDELSEDEKLGELRERYFGHSKPSTKIMALSEDSDGTVRYVDVGE